jgi:hypothetical protein
MDSDSDSDFEQPSDWKAPSNPILVSADSAPTAAAVSVGDAPAAADASAAGAADATAAPAAPAEKRWERPWCVRVWFVCPSFLFLLQCGFFFDSTRPTYCIRFSKTALNIWLFFLQFYFLLFFFAELSTKPYINFSSKGLLTRCAKAPQSGRWRPIMA